MAREKTPAELAISALKSAEISSRDTVKIVLAALEKRDKFEPEDVALCTSALMTTLRMVPLQDTIYRDGRNRLVIRGRLVKDKESEKMIINAARAMLHNVARKLVREKVEFECESLHRKAFTPFDILFANAALFFSQKEDEAYRDLVGEDGELEPEETE